MVEVKTYAMTCSALKTYSRKLVYADDGQTRLGEAVDPGEELTRLAKAYSAQHRVPFSAGLTAICNDPANASLVEAYNLGGAYSVNERREPRQDDDDERPDPDEIRAAIGKLDRLASALMKTNAEMTYEQAAKKVLAQNPTLARQYAAGSTE